MALHLKLRVYLSFYILNIATRLLDLSGGNTSFFTIYFYLSSFHSTACSPKIFFPLKYSFQVCRCSDIAGMINFSTFKVEMTWMEDVKTIGQIINDAPYEETCDQTGDPKHYVSSRISL